jgi:sensor histidine kinase YesM
MHITLPRIKSISFWHYQIAGWLVITIGYVFTNLISRNWAAQVHIVVVLQFVAGFILTFLLRAMYRKFNTPDRQIVSILGVIAVGSITFTLLWFTVICGIRYLLLPYDRFLIFIQLSTALQNLFAIFPIGFSWSCLYFGITIKQRWDREKERVEKATSLAQSAQLLMLQYQINPHFLFNVLNSLRALVDEDEKGARAMISELSEYLRYSLLEKNVPEVSLKDELYAIRQYLSIQKKGYEEKLDVSFNIDPETEHMKILSFLIHPLVENAVKFGMQTSPMPLRIKIESIRIGGRLMIIVKNTGRWVSASAKKDIDIPGTGTGLENVVARLENAYPGKYVFHTSENNGWVCATIKIVFNNGIGQ